MIGDRLAALDAALDFGRGVVDPATIERGGVVSERAGQRLRLSERHTVVAVAGATGSGKSSLVNAVVGAPVAAVDVLRPTTAEVMAVVGAGHEPESDADAEQDRRVPGDADALLDWLGVRSRVVHDGLPDDGLVLLDLPDHDSVRTEHRLEAERLVALVDLMVWVLDPQKYADAAIHERYLGALAAHRDVMLIVLNQADRLNERDLKAATADVRRLLDEDGLGGVPLLVTSARTGAGIDALRAALHDAAARRQARVDRLVADVIGVADQIAEQCGDAPRPVSGSSVALVDALAEAAGVPIVAEAVAGSVRLSARLATGWPPLRWLSRLRADPLRTLHLAGSDAGSGAGSDAGSEDALNLAAARTSLPASGPAQVARAAGAIRDWHEVATVGLPARWVAQVRATEPGDSLADQLDAAVAGTSVTRVRRPVWWRAFGALQWLLLTVAVVGIGWLVVIWGLNTLALPQPDPPTWGVVPVPTAMAFGGVASGLVLAGLARLLADVGARRQARRATTALRAAVADVAEHLVVEPASAVVDRWQGCRDAAGRASGGATKRPRGATTLRGRRGRG